MWKLLAAASAALLLFATRDAAAACQGRPTDAAGFLNYSYGTATVESFAGTNVVVHYATSGAYAPTLTSTRADGVPDTVAYAAARGDEALSAYAAMGYNAIPSDEACPSNGGDGKVDIYLVHFADADGSTFPECPGAPGTPCSSFVLCEATFAGRSYANADEGFSTVVTHELFHAEQNTYRTGDPSFWAEGTAQWGMHQVHPELQDFERQMPEFFSDPSRSIDSPSSGVTSSFVYGSAVWPLFLSLRFGVPFIHSIFATEAVSSNDPMTTIDDLLQKQGSSLAKEYPLFGAWNVGTGGIASTGGYPDATSYPGITPKGLTDGATAISSGFGYFAYRGTLTAPSQIMLDTDATRNQGVLVQVVNGAMDLAHAQVLPATATGDVIVVVSGVTAQKTDAPFTIHVTAAEADAGAPESDAGAPTTTVVTKDSGGCALEPTSESQGNLAALVIVLGLFGLRSRRKT